MWVSVCGATLGRTRQTVSTSGESVGSEFTVASHSGTRRTASNATCEIKCLSSTSHYRLAKRAVVRVWLGSATSDEGKVFGFGSGSCEGRLSDFYELLVVDMGLEDETVRWSLTQSIDEYIALDAYRTRVIAFSLEVEAAVTCLRYK